MPASAATLRAFIEETYRQGRVEGENGRVFELFPIGITQPAGELLRDIVVQAAPVRCLETGLAYGLSALFICEALLRSGQPEVRHCAIDPRQGWRFDNAGLRSLRRAGLGDLVEFHREDSQLVLPRLLAEGRRFDFAFVDGDHNYDAVFVDLYFLHRLMAPGGLIVVDDLWMPSVRTAVRFFETNLGYRCEGVGEAAPPAARGWRGLFRRPERPARMGLLRRPEKTEERAWDHFIPFA
ncbi:MAG: class I SAM-dependent methyltransferase [Planctomycetota bacterium]|nr:MAG: class I SAM-dependent methyltransferase [Planctomycetota bacterium]